MKPVPRILAVLSLVSLQCFSCSLVEAQRRPPNILVIVTDDMGYGDIGIHGSKDIPTPNIDALAKVGIRFTDAYVSGPYCSPSRAGLITGRYQQRFGHEFNLDMSPDYIAFGLPLSETTMANRLKDAGYKTALVGKWHLGFGDKFHPMARGFDEFFGFLGHSHSYLDTESATPNPIFDGRKVVTDIPYLTDALTDRAVDFIKRQKSHPFFLYLAFNAVHTPMETTDKYLARFAHIEDKQRRTYAAMLSAMDDGIGKTLAALRAEGLEENTLIVFFNDNGGPTMAGTTINGSSNAPLRGSKRQTWEGGIRVAFIIRWKGHLAEGKIDPRPIIQLDVLPTALAAAGVRSQDQFDGVNLLPFLTGKKAGRPHDALYWRLGENMAIRKGVWKLVRTQEGPLKEANSSTFEDLSTAELYNLAEDIGETKNLAAVHREKVRELAADWRRWNKKLRKPLWPPG